MGTFNKAFQLRGQNSRQTYSVLLEVDQISAVIRYLMYNLSTHQSVGDHKLTQKCMSTANIVNLTF